MRDLVAVSDSGRVLLEACYRAGARPLFVGGAVRDALMARAAGVETSIADVDIEVHGPPTVFSANSSASRR